MLLHGFPQLVLLGAIFDLHLLPHTVVIDLLEHLLLSDALLCQDLLLKSCAPFSTPLLLLQNSLSALGILLFELARVSNLLLNVILFLNLFSFNFTRFYLLGIIEHHPHLCLLFFFLSMQAIFFFFLLQFAEFDIVQSVLFLFQFILSLLLIQLGSVA